MVEHGAEIVAWATKMLGVREEPRGSNDGTALRNILSATAFKGGDKWCMFFAEAAVKAGFGENNPIPRFIALSGSCSDAANRANSAHYLSEWPATGAIALYRGGVRGFHHAGIVAAVHEDKGEFVAIEGNTNNSRSVEGYMVCRHTRKRQEAMFVIW